jgi:hypothetical protein
MILLPTQFLFKPRGRLKSEWLKEEFSRNIKSNIQMCSSIRMAKTLNRQNKFLINITEVHLTITKPKWIIFKQERKKSVDKH